MIKEAISLLVQRKDLSSEMMSDVMEEIMTNQATDAQKASFLTALAMKGETIGEITAAAKVMRAHCERFLNDMDVLEIVGTGGDGSNTFNISTLSALVTSAAGIPVAKHGNRAASSKCGTADCLEALGVKIDIAPALSAQLLKEINICFLFAQKYHTAMRFVGGVRKEMGIRTLFNILGPLANPAGATMQLLGVYSEDLVEPLAHVLKNLGVKRAMVVYGTDSIDEISFLCLFLRGSANSRAMNSNHMKSHLNSLDLKDAKKKILLAACRKKMQKLPVKFLTEKKVQKWMQCFLMPVQQSILPLITSQCRMQ